MMHRHCTTPAWFFLHTSNIEPELRVIVGLVAESQNSASA
jgi:hypothetical protein